MEEDGELLKTGIRFTGMPERVINLNNSRNGSHEGSITSLSVVKLCGIAQD